MMSYPHGMILDNTSNYGILKTETYMGFAPPISKNYIPSQLDSTEQMKWVLTPVKLNLDVESGRTLTKTRAKTAKTNTKSGRSKIHKCIFKVLKKGDNEDGSNDSGGTTRRRRKRRHSKIGKIGKKFLVPVILGLLAAKSVLIPIALKALAFLSSKGLVMGFFSTVLASVISIKGMFDKKSHYDRKDEKTQVEVIQIPPKYDDHYYTEEGYPYRRVDLMPINPAV